MLPTSRPLCSNSRLLLRGSAPKTRALSFSAAKWASGAPKQNSLVTSVTSEPAEAAVDRSKQRELAAVAREYLHHLPPSCQFRFDVLSVYYENQSSQPAFELFQNAFPVS